MSILKTSTSFSLATGVALALLAGSAGASAREVTVIREAIPEDALTERVSYADLNLASAAGIGKLTTRVRGAVRSVCRPLDDRSTSAEHVGCKSFAWNGAKPQMDRAITRAKQIAATGTSSLAPVAIVISAPAP